MTKNKTITYLFIFLFSLTGLLAAQTTKEEFLSDPLFAGGLYRPYSYGNSTLTPAPAGYLPFYISHYGRHGSRWVISPSCHIGPIKILSEANAAGKLTEAGKSLLQRMQVVAADAENRYGDLAPLGAKEERGIAERMFQSYPQVFSGKCFVYNRSTQVPRCILSMAAFDERLKELNPDITMLREASQRNKYLNNDAAIKADTIRKLQSVFLKKHFQPARFIANLISDTSYAKQAISDPEKFANQIFSAAVNIPNLDYLHFTLLDVFTPEELFILWQADNMFMYYLVGPSGINGGKATKSASLLLKNILDCADSAIKNMNVSADIRFGHDSYIIPLLALLEIQDMNIQETDPEKIYRAWNNFKASPMGANLQIIFFKNGSNDDILVKLLHCEKEVRIPVPTDIAPYYHWKDFKAYYEKKVRE